MLRTVLIVSLISLVLCGLAGAGFWVGRQSIRAEFRGLLDSAERVESLGNMFDETAITDRLLAIQRDGYHLAYEAETSIRERRYQTAWAGRVVYAPFVNYLQWPDTGVYQINGLQFRADRELVLPPSEGVFRIFITGGSTAFGTGSPEYGHTIGGFLQARLNEAAGPATGRRYEVYTMANPGWSTTHERIVIENRLSELGPDLVLSFSGNNDVYWGYEGHDILWYQDLVATFYRALLNRVYELAGSPAMPPVATAKEAPVPPAQVARRLAKNVGLARCALADAGIPYVFALQPSLPVSKKPLSDYEAAFLQQPWIEHFQAAYGLIDEILAARESVGFGFINLAPVFDGAGATEEIFLDSFHFGDRGNRLLAEALYRELARQKLLQPGAAKPEVCF